MRVLLNENESLAARINRALPMPARIMVVSETDLERYWSSACGVGVLEERHRQARVAEPSAHPDDLGGCECEIEAEWGAWLNKAVDWEDAAVVNE